MRPGEVNDEPAWDDVRPLLDEELARLPERLRAPLVLCYLEGKTNTEAARELGRPAGSLSKLLARGREVLRRRLTRARRGAVVRGAGPAAGGERRRGGAGGAGPGDARGGIGDRGGDGTAGLVSARVAGLVHRGLRDMFLAKCKLVLALVLTLAAPGRRRRCSEGPAAAASRQAGGRRAAGRGTEAKGACSTRTATRCRPAPWPASARSTCGTGTPS